MKAFPNVTFEIMGMFTYMATKTFRNLSLIKIGLKNEG